MEAVEDRQRVGKRVDDDLLRYRLQLQEGRAARREAHLLHVPRPADAEHILGQRRVDLGHVVGHPAPVLVQEAADGRAEEHLPALPGAAVGGILTPTHLRAVARVAAPLAGQRGGAPPADAAARQVAQLGQLPGLGLLLELAHPDLHDPGDPLRHPGPVAERRQEPSPAGREELADPLVPRPEAPLMLAAAEAHGPAGAAELEPVDALAHGAAVGTVQKRERVPGSCRGHQGALELQQLPPDLQLDGGGLLHGLLGLRNGRLYPGSPRCAMTIGATEQEVHELVLVHRDAPHQLWVFLCERFEKVLERIRLPLHQTLQIPHQWTPTQTLQRTHFTTAITADNACSRFIVRIWNYCRRLLLQVLLLVL
mmetsp:Transcript_70587/g.206601  ORF Transcript_70587/g.206601 Transcript_70587/m.206601 type:complete len:367 (-) Transcript_70587:268-1368(-)